MERLAKSISEAVGDFEPKPTGRPWTGAAPVLRAAAHEWAKCCIDTFRDDLLRKGLAMSAAMADFLAELELCDPSARETPAGKDV